MKKSEILFFYTDDKFKKYVKNNYYDIFKKSVFLKKQSDIFKLNLENIKVISVFVDNILDKKFLNNFSNLKMIMARSTGTDHIDLDYCLKNNIKVESVPDYGSMTVAEYALSILLYSLKNLGELNEKNRGVDLNGKKIGIIGLGKIGKNFAKLVNSFGVEIMAYDPFFDENFAKELNIKKKSLNELLKKSDIISIHAPLNKKTFHLIGKNEFEKMKDGVYLINTSRGGIIDTKYLYEFLKSKKIKKAALDVLENENHLIKREGNLNKKEKEILNLNRKIIKMKKVFWSPHQAYNTFEAVERIWKESLEKIKKNIK